MKIYTKTGDAGETSLFGGKRVTKDNSRIDAYGTIDELNALLGLSRTETNDKKLDKMIEEIQNGLFTAGADLATPFENERKGMNVPRINEEDIRLLEKYIDEIDALLPELKAFILPGGSRAASLLHLARTICRRGERKTVALSLNEDIGKFILIYLNRLSDLLFVLARYANFVENTPDVEWKL